MKKVMILVMMSIPFLAFSQLTGYWQTGISNSEYLFHVKNLEMPFYQHNRGEVPAYNKKAWLRMMKKIREGRGAMGQAQGDAKP